MHHEIIRAGIVGAAGYTGGELIRLLLGHPGVAIRFAQSRSSAGKPLHAVHTDLIGETELRFSAAWDLDVDVIFICSGHGEARKWMEAANPPAALRIIDLSHDFRLSAAAVIGDRRFVYGLPELHAPAIRVATAVANPGCFATAIQLGLLPLAAAGELGDVHTTGITGSTGAGQSLSATTHFSWRASNISAYKALGHQHVAEIEQSLHALGSAGAALHFVPWRGDFSRGIYVSSVAKTALTQAEAIGLYQAYYADAAFTFVSETMVDLKQVVNTNKCVIFPEVSNGHIAVHSAIDNLLKGASGQAVQNMNLMFGLAETAGLQLKPGAF